MFSKTKKIAKELEQRDRAVLMKGRTLYDFPSTEVFENLIEEETKIDMEREALKTLGNSVEFALTMCQNEKVILHSDPIVHSEVDDHVQFLTDDSNKKPGGEEAIFKKNKLIKKPGQYYKFIELCEVEAQMMQDNANEFDKKVLYQKINKVANMPNIQELCAEHPEYLYYMECSQDTDTPLPILSHIYANTLTLANYTLSGGHCKALNRAAKYLQTNINRVRFDNCGIDDEEMADLL